MAHGDCGGERSNGLALRVAERARRSKRFTEVHVGFMKGEPPLETAFSAIGNTRVRVLPLFLSDGYYVETAIPRRLGLHHNRDAEGRQVIFSRPLGLDPRLPGVLAQAAVDCAWQHGMAPAGLDILLVAHGSKTSDKSAIATRQVAAEIAKKKLFAAVNTAFLEQAPFFAEVLPACAGPTLVIGLFAGEGQHAVEDVSGAVSRLGRKDVFQLGQLSACDGLLDIALSGLVPLAD